jgi:hypothetical protein
MLMWASELTIIPTRPSVNGSTLSCARSEKAPGANPPAS